MTALARLPHRRRTAIIGVLATCGIAIARASGAADAGVKDSPAQQNEHLDVTMQVIADPNAKLPDEVIRRIPLPPRKPASAAAASGERGKGNEASGGEERSREAQEVGREISDRAKERTQDATEQREQARRAVADERRRNPPPPPDPPRPPR